MTPITITRRQAKAANACVGDTRRVLDHLRERDGRLPRLDDPISLRDVADVLGVDGVIWCLGARGEDDLLRRFACRCARRALRRAKVRDPRSWRAIRVAWWHAHGWATGTARSAARAAVWSAAWDAAHDAAQDAAHVAARAAAQDAARDVAWYVAWYVAQDAAWDAAHDAAQAWQVELLLTMSGYGEAG